jgi:hypothetical protein
MRDSAPTIVFCVSMLTLAAMAILHINNRLDAARLRGAPDYEWTGIALLAIFGAAVILSSRWLRDPWIYALAPASAAVIVAAYTLGTARLD